MKRKFTAIYIKDVTGGYVVRVEELPNVVTEGETLEEARDMVKDAIALVLEVERDDLAKELEGHEVIREEVTVEVPEPAAINRV